ncbi:MAG: hypothetical protein JWN02_2510 [Acidobacteria bacterium]|nr:hypothetical protein [Acidobacteriota bacterium]
MAARALALAYTGPVCPRCGKPLDLPTLRDGEDICPSCSGFFELRLFHPPQRVVHVAALATAVDAATPCANHPRNVAVANCQRCGIFICSLCELEVGGDHYCPSCFDRLSQEGALPGALLRFRDYSRLSMTTAVVGLLMSVFFGLPLGIAAIYYAIKAFRDPNTFRGARVGLVLAILIGIGDILLGGYFLWSLFRPLMRR